MSRAVILTEIIAPYRIPVFNALACQPQIELHVIFLAENDSTLRQWHVYKDELSCSYEVLPSWRKRIAGKNILLNWGLTSALRHAAPDAILCGGYNYVASWQSLRWARRNHVRFLAWVESTGNDIRRNHRAIESLKTTFLRHCDGFVVPGKSSFKYLRNYGMEASTIHVAPNAVDTRFFSQKAEAARAENSRIRGKLHLPSRFFLFVGRLVREKGVFDLLQAYGTLAPQLRTEVGLVFVGDGPARVQLDKIAATIDPGTVHFAGFAQRELLPSYYALADAFVFPTRSDTWGLVVNEAMSCGLPVITSDIAGCAADLVEDNCNGYAVPARDITGLATAMVRLASAPELCSRMARFSRERIRRYSPEICAQGIADAFVTRSVLRHG